MANNYVYKITFPEREKQGLYPCFYIGSKSNATFKDGIIYGSRGEYWGSSECVVFKQLISSNEPKNVTILDIAESYDELISKERDFHLRFDVVADCRFFNKSIATENTYANPDYATYRNINTGKVSRLPRKHLSVLNGEWVGVTKGRVMGEATKNKISKWNKENGNPFSGMKHSEESKLKQVEGRKRWAESNPEKYSEMIMLQAERVRELSLGKPKPEDHRKKISESTKGLVTIKNQKTGETKRVRKDELCDYDSDWKNPYQIACQNGTVMKYECSVCGGMFVKSMLTRWHGENCKKAKDARS